MNQSDDEDGMPSLVHDSSDFSSADEGKPRKDKTKKKKKKKKAPPPGSSDEEGEPAPQTGGVGLRKRSQETDDAKGAASSAAAASGDGLAEMTPKALKELIGSAGLSTDGCIDKDDLVELARKAKAMLAEQQVRAERERQRREEDERARAAEAESSRKREEERAAREEVQRKRDEEKRLADEHTRMVKLLNECGVQQHGQSAARSCHPQLGSQGRHGFRAWAARAQWLLHAVWTRASAARPPVAAHGAAVRVYQGLRWSLPCDRPAAFDPPRWADGKSSTN